MAITSSTALRFREFRERAGLTHAEVARHSGISTSCIWDIETQDDELSSCYSPVQLRQFCHILGIRPIALFDGDFSAPPISANELVKLMNDQCQALGITWEQFENLVGWRLSFCIEPPERFLEKITVDGLQWLCRELGIDWRQVILSL